VKQAYLIRYLTCLTVVVLLINVRALLDLRYNLKSQSAHPIGSLPGAAAPDILLEGRILNAS